MSAPRAIIAEDEPLLRGELKRDRWPRFGPSSKSAPRPTTASRRFARSRSTRPISCSSTSRCRG